MIETVVIEHIEKELEYAESKYGYQSNLSIKHFIELAIKKLSESYSPCSTFVCGNSYTFDCNNKLKLMCNAFAAIAILIRGISANIKKDELNTRRKHLDVLIKNMIKEE